MTPSQEKRLKARFPRLFRLLGDRTPRKLETIFGQAEVIPTIGYGIECGPGWYALVAGLARTLEAQISWLPERQQSDVCAVQVKEKFGELRFYVQGKTPAMEAAIERAKKKSIKVCEDCGRPGRRRNMSGWWTTLCTQHVRKRRDPEAQALAERRATFLTFTGT